MPFVRHYVSWVFDCVFIACLVIYQRCCASIFTYRYCAHCDGHHGRLLHVRIGPRGAVVVDLVARGSAAERHVAGGGQLLRCSRRPGKTMRICLVLLRRRRSRMGAPPKYERDRRTRDSLHGKDWSIFISIFRWIFMRARRSKYFPTNGFLARGSRTGGVGVVAAAILHEDRYLPERHCRWR